MFASAEWLMPWLLHGLPTYSEHALHSQSSGTTAPTTQHCVLTAAMVQRYSVRHDRLLLYHSMIFSESAAAGSGTENEPLHAHYWYLRWDEVSGVKCFYTLITKLLGHSAVA